MRPLRGRIFVLTLRRVSPDAIKFLVFSEEERPLEIAFFDRICEQISLDFRTGLCYACNNVALLFERNVVFEILGLPSDLFSFRATDASLVCLILYIKNIKSVTNRLSHGL